MSRGSLLGVALLLAGAVPAAAQDTLPLPEVLRRVELAHPLLRRQAALAGAQAARASATRGAFDPVLALSAGGKTKDDKLATRRRSIDLSLPLAEGPTVFVRFEDLRGPELLPGEATKGGQLSAGVRVPLTRGVWTNERRALRAVADARATAAEADLALERLRVLGEATAAYAQWYEATTRLAQLDTLLERAERRQAALRARVVHGESAPIDTLEGALEVARRAQARAEGLAAELGARERLSLWLWSEEGEPMDVVVGTRPSLPATLPAGVPNPRHPALAAVAADVEARSVERAYRGRLLLPDIDGEVYAKVQDSVTSTSLFDPTWKVTARSSLFLREARGTRDATTLDWQASRWRASYAAADLAATQRILGARLEALATQRRLQLDALRAAAALVAGEQQRFTAGESTLFLVIQRERQWLDELLTAARLDREWLTTWAQAQVAAGQWAAN